MLFAELSCIDWSWKQCWLQWSCGQKKDSRWRLCWVLGYRCEVWHQLVLLRLWWLVLVLWCVWLVGWLLRSCWYQCCCRRAGSCWDPRWWKVDWMDQEDEAHYQVCQGRLHRCRLVACMWRWTWSCCFECRSRRRWIRCWRLWSLCRHLWWWVCVGRKQLFRHHDDFDRDELLGSEDGLRMREGLWCRACSHWSTKCQMLEYAVFEKLRQDCEWWSWC